MGAHQGLVRVMSAGVGLGRDRCDITVIRILVDTVRNPLGSVCYPPHSPFLHEFHVSCLVHGLHGVWCSFQGLVCVNSAGVALGRDGT